MTGATTIVLLPFILVMVVTGALLSAVFGLAGVGIAIAFGLLAIFLRSFVILWLALLLGVVAGLLGAGGAIAVLLASAIWIGRLVKNRRTPSTRAG